MDTNVPTPSRRIRTLAAAAAAFAVAAQPAAACDGADARISEASPGTLRSATVCLVNKRRAANGLKRLHRDRDLREAAQRYAQSMVDSAFFSHVSPGGSDVVDRLKATGFITPSEAWLVGENLAWGVGDLGTPREIVRSWTASPGH